MARRVKVTMLMASADMIRFGYEALAWSFVRMSIEPRFATVDTESSADWKLVRIQSSDWKRRWKYGPAARNMFLIRVSRCSLTLLSLEAHQAHSMAIPSRKNIEYSSHENCVSSVPSILSPSGVMGPPSNGS